MVKILFILSAFFMGLAQQPWGLGFLAWVSFIPCLYFFNTQSNIKSVIGYAFLWGFIYHLTFLYWLSGNVGMPTEFLKYLTMILVPSFLALNMVVIFFLYFILKKYFDNYYIIYILPFIIVSIEFLRSFGLYGFTWNSFSYTQSDYLIVAQNIEYTGMYGLSFWIVLINVIIYDLINNFSKTKVYILILSFWFPWVTGIIIKYSYNDNLSTLNVKVVQPNISLEDKRNNLMGSVEILIDLSEKTSNSSVDLIIWPEASIPGFFIKDNQYNRQSHKMNTFLNRNKFSLVAGLDLNDNDKKYNAAALFKNTSLVNVYHKQRLVPNVEYTPGIFDTFGLNLGSIQNFDIGTELSLFNVNGHDFASMICIESIFPNPTRSFVDKGAKFIVYIVNDGWYETAPEPQQHAKRCIYRAIENRRSVIRCANTGISMIIDPYGNIIEESKLNTKDVIEESIKISDEKTFYTKYGDLFSVVNVIILLLMGLSIIFRKFYGKLK